MRRAARLTGIMTALMVAVFTAKSFAAKSFAAMSLAAMSLAATSFASMILAAMVVSAGPAQAQPAEQVKVLSQFWKKGGFNTIGVADITIANENAFAVKDIKVRCVFTAKASGKTTEIQQTIAGSVPARSEKTFKKVSFGFIDSQAVDGACEVRGVTQI